MRRKKGRIVKPRRRFTEKQQAFIDAMEENPYNQAAAARKAGYKHPIAVGCQLMDMAEHPDVAREVERRLRAKRKDCGIDTRKAVEELSHIALFDPLDLVNEDGTPKDLREMPIEVRKAVRSFDFRTIHDKEGRVIERKVIVKECYGKLDAWNQIAKLLGLNRERPIVNINQTTVENVVVMTDVERLQALRAIYRAAQRRGAVGAEKLLAEVPGGGRAEDSNGEGDAARPVLGPAGAADEDGGDRSGRVADGSDEGGLEEGPGPLL